MRVSLRGCAVAICLVVLTGLILVLVKPSLDPAKIRPLPLVTGAWLVFAVAAWLLRKMPVKLAVPLILLGAVAIQLAALSAPPQTSSDMYRYIWDGRVQAAGIDPYLYAPGDKGVAFLRNDLLWSGTTGPNRYGGCVHTYTNTLNPSHGLVRGCTRMNRPTVPTIYPPVAEAYFLGVQVAAPADNSTKPMQAAAALCALATTVILLFGLRILRKDVRMAALWAWCPTVALEAGNNAHVDVLAVAITALALLILARARTEGRAILGGVLLGLAIATKVTPALVLPAVLRRRWFAILASAGTAVALVYAPHAMAVGSRIIGFFPGYLKEEGYTSGSRFGLLDLVFKDKVATGIAVLVLAGVAYLVLRNSDPEQPWHGAVLMTATALAVTTPLYQWYALLLVMLVALDGHPEWLGIAAGGYVIAEPLKGAWFAPPDPKAFGYGAGLAVALTGAFIRYRLAHPGQAVARDVPLMPLTPRATETPLAAAGIPQDTSTPSQPTPSPAGALAGTGTYQTAGTSAGA
jgi:hypothetical protein